jgi:hypothetical protein
LLDLDKPESVPKFDIFPIPEPNIFERRRNISGATLTNTIIDWFPFTMTTKTSDGSIGSVTGLMVDLLDMIRQVNMLSFDEKSPNKLTYKLLDVKIYSELTNGGSRIH